VSSARDVRNPLQKSLYLLRTFAIRAGPDLFEAQAGRNSGGKSRRMPSWLAILFRKVVDHNGDAGRTLLRFEVQLVLLSVLNENGIK
jgi:hypothetical protein